MPSTHSNEAQCRWHTAEANERLERGIEWIRLSTS
jgi:hypothetical protein